MARKKRGYSRRARRDHPGVTIASEAGRVVLRWREVLPGNKPGRRRKQALVDAADRPVPSRTAAHPYAVRKSEELARDREKYAALDADDYEIEAGWQALITRHAEYLTNTGRAARTIKVYGESWAHLDTWPERPARPHDLTLRKLETYAGHLSRQKHTHTGAPLSPHYVATLLRQFKALLNFGRRRLKCVRLDQEAVAGALAPPRRTFNPVALPTRTLRAILEGAGKFDDQNEDAGMFPLLAFVMLTGCRRAEAEHLRWQPSTPGALESWPDPDGNRVLIYGSKTGRQRVVSLEHRPALAAMLEHLREQADPVVSPFVFGGALPLAIGAGRKADGAGNLGQSAKRALSVVQEMSGGGWRVKDLRSTAATYLCNSDLGSNLYLVAGQLGHDYQILVKHYAHQYALPDKQRTAATVEELLGVADLLKAWTRARTAGRGRLIKLRGRA